MQPAHVLHELDHSFSCVDHGVDENDDDLVLKMMNFNVMGHFGVHEHSERESIRDVIGLGLASTHEGGDCGVLLMEEVKVVDKAIKDV